MAQQRFHFFKSFTALSVKLTLFTSIFTLAQTPQILTAQGIPTLWEGKEYSPPSGIGTPSNTAGAGTRAPRQGCLVTGKPLTALLPSNNFGVTENTHPQFFVYMPAIALEEESIPVEFLLETQDGKDIYQTRFNSNGKDGILAISLPNHESISPLEVDGNYKWSVAVICDPDERSMDIAVEGWVRRVKLDSTFNHQLRQLSLSKQVELYAEAEIWHDALASLAQLRLNNPDDSEIAAEWSKLLSAVGLNEFSQESIIPVSLTSTLELTSSSHQDQDDDSNHVTDSH
ncbi:MAG: DUF928 domain-containing protein [Symploca sp. SIO1C4]|uniref:DUF928 domain-containing protein n=1 Tax=Symploca sp. SIO1C4 TaxID=2607765 RepID=A0A6B3NIC4_9CYAN|nr:DUF928 domain-containing protein [Symploca sp. SIO1C4]NET08593.1 DUF928 domain-containing protein [Symploca sp. SIO2B6]